MDFWQHLSEQIQAHTQQQYTISRHSSMGGGCINQAYKVSNGQRDYFVKVNDLSHGDMFEVEALALQEMAATQTLRVPQPVCYGQHETQAYVVMEYLELGGRANATQLGQQLAAMHRVQSKQFGWHRNNTIGSSPQSNQQSHDWIHFWREQRLQPQLTMAQKNGYGNALSSVSDRLLSEFPKLFESYQPQASMCHGDLWGGNASGLEDGTPVIYDPALYYGDREVDIAMTHLFGGFSSDFYAAYQDAWPLDEGFKTRRTLYNLYHILNHLNLFGSGYLGQALSMSEQLLSEL